MQARVLLSNSLVPEETASSLTTQSRGRKEDERSRVSSCILIECMTLKERQRSSRLQGRRLENESRCLNHSRTQSPLFAPQDDWLTNSCSSSFLFVFPMALRGMASSTFTIVGVL